MFSYFAVLSGVLLLVVLVCAIHAGEIALLDRSEGAHQLHIVFIARFVFFAPVTIPDSIINLALMPWGGKLSTYCACRLAQVVLPAKCSFCWKFALELSLHLLLGYDQAGCVTRAQSLRVPDHLALLHTKLLIDTTVYYHVSSLGSKKMPIVTYIAAFLKKNLTVLLWVHFWVNCKVSFVSQENSVNLEWK